MGENMKITRLNESVEHPYMFQYSCNNSTFGYDFQRYAQELGANRMYDHTQKGGGLHFYTVPSEDVYNKLKEVAKKRFMVDMYSLRPFDRERYANAKIQESMTIAYDKSTITNMIDRIQRNLEDYKSLLTEFPEDGEYWREMIHKCEIEIAELESYEPLDETLQEDNNDTSDFEYIKNKFGAKTRYGTTVIDGDKSDEIARTLSDKGYTKGARKSWSTGSSVEYTNANGSKISVGVDKVDDYDGRGIVRGNRLQTILTQDKDGLNECTKGIQENLSIRNIQQKRRK